MRTTFVLSLLAFGFIPLGSAFALPGENVRDTATPPSVRPPANERSQPQVYPYVYRKAGYLATMGPLPMRFGPASPNGNERTPPRVPFANKKHELSETAEALARTEAIETYRSVHGRLLPVPAGSSAGGVPANSSFMDQGNISTGSNEVLEFFQLPQPEPEVQKRQNRFLFDPVPPFSAAQPPSLGTQPPSRATYQKN
ncbi:MAG: hypothetical protein DVB28_002024 [Verrucomicrobia bacterium]|nr:MAG: hypothetical protein DVB28_002024 [Verrucomicrobiota bacterium]